MKDLDWFQAFFLGTMGMFLGPLIAFAGWYVHSIVYWPNGGEGTIAASMIYTFSLPLVLVAGSMGGTAIGFFWGLVGSELRDRLAYRLTRLVNRTTNRRRD